MKPLQLFCTALSLLFLLVTVSAPATLLDAGLHAFTQGKLRLVLAQGTLWSGQGQLEIRDAVGAAALNKTISWNLKPEQLLRLRLHLDFRVFPQTQSGSVSASLAGLELTNFELNLPVAAAAVLVPHTTGYELGGDLSLDTDRLVFTRAATEGTLVVKWHDASSSLAPITPLGSYEFRFTGSPAPVHFNLAVHTLQGPLQLEGTGSIGTSGPAAYSVTARMPPPEYAVLAPFLQLVAIEAADRSFMLQR